MVNDEENDKKFENEDQIEKEEQIEIEVINGDGSEIEVSEVHDHLNAVVPKTKDEEEIKEKIIIPEVKKK